MPYSTEDVERLAEKIFRLHYPNRPWSSRITVMKCPSGSAGDDATPAEQTHFRALAREQLERPL